MGSRSILDVDPSRFASLSPTESVEFFASLLWCSAFRHGIPATDITVSFKSDVADGGIDADIRKLPAGAAKGDLLLQGNSWFQLKAGHSAKPWQMAWVHSEFYGTKSKRTVLRLGEGVRRCLDAA